MERIIKKSSVEPIRKIWVTESLVLHVQFENGSRVSHKITTALRVFLATLQNVRFDRTTPGMSRVRSPLGFYDLLGFKIGDTIRAHGFEQDIFILFSDP